LGLPARLLAGGQAPSFTEQQEVAETFSGFCGSPFGLKARVSDRLRDGRERMEMEVALIPGSHNDEYDVDFRVFLRKEYALSPACHEDIELVLPFDDDMRYAQITRIFHRNLMYFDRQMA